MAFNDIVLIKRPIYEDIRGSFEELYNPSIGKQLGVTFVQDNLSISEANVFRGMHYQFGDHAQGKLVTVIDGLINDFVLCIDPNDPEFGKYQVYGIYPGQSIYIPPRYAHGFFAKHKSIVYYKVTTPFDKESERSIYYKSAGIILPVVDPIMSNKDRTAVDFEVAALSLKSKC